ncbi:protein YIF1A isoform X2 [Alligator mississippiensis]|uniref:protein YIF1A isoform X2 n=1 Tax=Alligator mississippiensis TaxID=8496 RepID=UPI0003D09323|nr:protein YIF1A isoform X2 [Alligator mississippiensis]
MGRLRGVPGRDRRSKAGLCPAGSKQRLRGPPVGSPPQLFDDTSADLGPPHAGPAAPAIDMGFGALLPGPVADAAAAYGASLASHGQDVMHTELQRFVAGSRLRHLFAVDTAYVARKLGLLLFPFAHQHWELQTSHDLPLPPRQDLNAPDLYIPTMAFITYVLLAGMALGLQDRFSPEALGLWARRALGWALAELLALLLGLYVAAAPGALGLCDLLAYSGYKYVGMLLAVLGGLVLGPDGFHVLFAWTSCALAYFLARSLRTKLSPAEGLGAPRGAGRGRSYLPLAVAALQPFVAYWLTAPLLS